MHGSRRVGTLQPGDYDHEITILDDEDGGESQRAVSSEGRELAVTNTFSSLLSDQEAETEDEERPSHRGERQGQDEGHLQPSSALKGKNAETHIYQLPTAETTSSLRPSVSGEGPSIEIRGGSCAFHFFHDPC
jgi:hypothetical protein